MTDLVQELSPCVSRKSASRQVSRHIITKSIKKGRTKGVLTPQSTASGSSAITVEQQFRWHTLVNKQFKRLRLKNTGICNLSHKTFGVVMAHFLWGLDEESTCADHNGDVKITGSAGKMKYEKILQDSRVSITLVRTGSAGGSTGPTIFLLKGKVRSSIYSDIFLRRWGWHIEAQL